MALLLVEHQGRTRGTKLPARVLIGRRSMNHLIIDDPTVSRMHAWIDQRGADFILTDMRSRTGTRVNGQPLAKRRKLVAGDVIEIGPARLTFQSGDTVPADVQPLVLPREPVMLARDIGIRFDCPHCRAPMWASKQYAGHGGICTYCGEGFTIPRSVVNAPAVSRSAAAAVVATAVAPAITPNEAVAATTAATLPQAPPAPIPQYKPRPAASAQPVASVTTPPTNQPAPADRPALASAATSVAPGASVTVPSKSGTSQTSSRTADPVAPPESVASIVSASSPAMVDDAVAAEDVVESPGVTVPAIPAPAPTQTLAAPPPTRTTSSGITAPAPVFDAATTFVAPEPATYTEPPAVAGKFKCGVCHSPILPGESLTACPSCNLRFHVECWQENYGCSAYGCPQVNALAPQPEPSAEPEVTAEDTTIDMSPPRTPWEFVLLGLSAVGAVVSGFTFGVASLCMLVWSILYLVRSKADPERKAGPIYAAIALSAVGVAAGAAVSYFLFLYGRK